MWDDEGAADPTAIKHRLPPPHIYILFLFIYYTLPHPTILGSVPIAYHGKRDIRKETCHK